MIQRNAHNGERALLRAAQELRFSSPCRRYNPQSPIPRAGAEPLGDVLQPTNPRWYSWRLDGAQRFLGRRAELWRLHQLMMNSPGGAVEVRGASGMGKSMLAEEYALRFATAYPAGVYFLQASRSEPGIPGALSPAAAAADRHLQIRGLARGCGQDPSDMLPEHVRVLLGRTFEGVGLGRYLWVVDGLPAEVDEEERQAWMAPQGDGHTLFTTTAESGDDPQVLTLAPLAPEVARRTLVAGCRLGGATTVDAGRLHAAIEQTFTFRGTHDMPDGLPEPPESWEAPYAAMAREDRLPWTTLAKAFVAARSFLDPVLAGRLDETWNSSEWTWAHPTAPASD